jgi:predicted phage baseplate assembly protein
MSLRDPNECGCDGDEQRAASAVRNRPGLPAISYRAGTHATFKRAMLERLASADLPQLRALGTREDDDFAIALLDAWATVADVQTFYSERIANELYLRTAGERLSLLHLAQLIGYTPRLGLAAGTYLAFTLDDAPGAPGQAARPTTFEAGLKVQSVPGPGEKPQIFETVERIQARVEWNVIRPRLTERHPLPIPNDPDHLLLEGVSTHLRAGDRLLVVPEGGGDPALRRIATVTLVPQYQHTSVELQPNPPALKQPDQQALKDVGKRELPQRGSITKRVLPKLTEPISAARLQLRARVMRVKARQILDNLAATRQPSPGVLAFRTKAAIFGHHAPRWDTLPRIQRIGRYEERETNWAEAKLVDYPRYDEDTDEATGAKPDIPYLYLDTVYPQIVARSWVVLSSRSDVDVYEVQDTTELSRIDFTLNARVSRLTLDRKVHGSFPIRTTSVFAQSELLPLARLPIKEAVDGAQIQLDGWVDGLFVGQGLIFCGELSDMLGVRECEYATIAEVENNVEADGYTQIKLRSALKNSYVRATLTIYGNVARATHGETVQEVLGGGDAAKPYQRFTLSQPPLTNVSAATPSGAASTLAVRVNDLLWHEVPTLYGHAADEHIYVTHTDDAGATTIQFGARLPSGQANIRATYRRGSGLAGLVQAGQLSMLLTRPLGVKGVTNPLAASGAADPEALDDMRRNAPLTVLTLDRIVSLQDYEDFARAFSGIAKALATWIWDGQARGVFVTVAGPNGDAVEPDSALYMNLLAAMRQNGDPYVPLQVQSYQPAFFSLSANLKIHPDYVLEQVLAAAKLALGARFGFDARAFGQPVALGEVMAALQATPGVLAVDIDHLAREDATPSADNSSLLAAAMPQAGATQALPAELLLLATELIDLKVLP